MREVHDMRDDTPGAEFELKLTAIARRLADARHDSAALADQAVKLVATNFDHVEAEIGSFKSRNAPE
jgi:hypothetical protein